METFHVNSVYSSCNFHGRYTILSRNVSLTCRTLSFTVYNFFSPRWLIDKGYINRAVQSLRYLRGIESDSSELISNELAQIKSAIEIHRPPSGFRSWTVLFTNKTLFKRLWRAALLQFMSQMCGNTAIKYYLPTIFISLGIERKLSLMIGGIESTLKIGCTIIEMLIIDKLGRRITLITGCIVMSIALLVSYALFVTSDKNLSPSLPTRRRIRVPH